MTERGQRILVTNRGTVAAEDRRRLLRQRGCVVWFTGLSGSGKSTLANALEAQLLRRGNPAYVLDGDNVRQGLNADLGFSSQDRTENIRRIAEVANLFADAGLIAITAFISPYQADRQAARGRCAAGPFIEVYVDAPLEVCERRDPKGLYRRARAGEIQDFTGIDAPYESPADPELQLRTEGREIASCVDEIVAYLVGRNILESGTNDE